MKQIQEDLDKHAKRNSEEFLKVIQKELEASFHNALTITKVKMGTTKTSAAASSIFLESQIQSSESNLNLKVEEDIKHNYVETTLTTPRREVDNYAETTLTTPRREVDHAEKTLTTPRREVDHLREVDQDEDNHNHINVASWNTAVESPKTTTGHSSYYDSSSNSTTAYYKGSYAAQPQEHQIQMYDASSSSSTTYAAGYYDHADQSFNNNTGLGYAAATAPPLTGNMVPQDSSAGGQGMVPQHSSAGGQGRPHDSSAGGQGKQETQPHHHASFYHDYRRNQGLHGALMYNRVNQDVRGTRAGSSSSVAPIYEKGNVCSRCEVLSDILGPKTLILRS